MAYAGRLVIRKATTPSLGHKKTQKANRLSCIVIRVIGVTYPWRIIGTRARVSWYPCLCSLALSLLAQRIYPYASKRFPSPCLLPEM